MQDAELVQIVKDDPLVRERNVKRNADGTATPISDPELQTRITAQIGVAIGKILLDQSIARATREQVYTLTVTTATDYDLPSYVGRIVNVRRSSDNWPIDLIQTADEYDRFRAERYPWPDSGSIEAAFAWRDPVSHNWKLTIMPGPSAGGTLAVRYIIRPVAPYTLGSLPPELHPLVLVMVLNRMTGGSIPDEVNEVKADTIRSISGPAASVSQQHYPRSTQWRVRRINSGSSSAQRPSWQGYGP